MRLELPPEYDWNYPPADLAKHSAASLPLHQLQLLVHLSLEHLAHVYHTYKDNNYLWVNGP